MQFIDNINNFVDNMYDYGQAYWDELPQNTFAAIALSFTAVALFDCIQRGYLDLTPAILAATTTAIHAFVTPLFKRFCGGHDLRWTEEMCRSSIALIGAAGVAAAFSLDPALTGLTIIQTIFIKVVIYGVVNIFPSRRSVESALIMAG